MKAGASIVTKWLLPFHKHRWQIPLCSKPAHGVIAKQRMCPVNVADHDNQRTTKSRCNIFQLASPQTPGETKQNESINSPGALRVRNEKTCGNVRLCVYQMSTAPPPPHPTASSVGPSFSLELSLAATCLLTTDRHWTLCTCLLTADPHWTLSVSLCTCLLAADPHWTLCTCLLAADPHWTLGTKKQNYVIPGKAGKMVSNYNNKYLSSSSFRHDP